MHLYLSLSIYIYIYIILVHVYIYIYIYTCTYIYIYIYIHTGVPRKQRRRLSRKETCVGTTWQFIASRPSTPTLVVKGSKEDGHASNGGCSWLCQSVRESNHNNDNSSNNNSNNDNTIIVILTTILIIIYTREALDSGVTCFVSSRATTFRLQEDMRQDGLLDPPNHGVESSFCCWIAGQRLFHRRRYHVISSTAPLFTRPCKSPHRRLLP